MTRVSRRSVIMTAAAACLTALVGRVAVRKHRPTLERTFVENDYEAERVVNVGGWLMSATEARFCSET